MINPVPLLLLMSLAFTSNAGDYAQLPYQKDRKTYGLKASVMALTEQTFMPPKDSAYYWGSKVILKEEAWRLDRSEELLFDSSGRMLKRKVEEWEDTRKRKMIIREENFFYQMNRLSAVSTFEDKKRGDSIGIHYKRNGLPEYYSWFNHKNDLQYKVTFTYGRDNKVAWVRKKNEGNLPISMIKYKYEKGKLQQAQYFDDQFRLSETTRYSEKRAPDGQSNESYAVFLADGKMKEGLSTVKDTSGNLLEQSVINGDRQVSDYRSFKYDLWGNNIEERLFSPVEITIASRYEYDKKGNWIRKEIYHNGWLQQIVIRALTYGS